MATLLLAIAHTAWREGEDRVECAPLTSDEKNGVEEKQHPVYDPVRRNVIAGTSSRHGTSSVTPDRPLAPGMAIRA